MKSALVVGEVAKRGEGTTADETLKVLAGGRGVRHCPRRAWHRHLQAEQVHAVVARVQEEGGKPTSVSTKALPPTSSHATPHTPPPTPGLKLPIVSIRPDTRTFPNATAATSIRRPVASAQKKRSDNAEDNAVACKSKEVEAYPGNKRDTSKAL